MATTSSSMEKSQVRLPPVIIDGEPKALHDLKVKHLHMALIAGLKASLGHLSGAVGAFHYFDYSIPSWWPHELRWRNDFMNDVPHKKRAAYLRHLLHLCYAHYHQEDTLHLFDVAAGDKPHWTLVERETEWVLFNTDTGADLWHFKNHYQILPLIALAAKQEEHSNIKVLRHGRYRKPVKSVRSKPITRSRKMAQEVQKAASVVKAFRKRSMSILDGYHPKDHYGSCQEEKSVRAENFVIYCSKCDTPCMDDMDLVKHSAVCYSANTAERAKNVMAFNLGLIPTKIYDKIWQDLHEVVSPFERTYVHNLSPESLSRVPFSSELGQIVYKNFELSKAEQLDRARDVSDRCMRTLPVLKNTNALESNDLPYPIVYRPIRGLKSSMIEYKLTGTDRKRSIQKKKDLQIFVKQVSRQCVVKLHRLMKSEIKGHIHKSPIKRPDDVISKNQTQWVKQKTRSGTVEQDKNMARPQYLFHTSKQVSLHELTIPLDREEVSIFQTLRVKSPTKKGPLAGTPVTSIRETSKTTIENDDSSAMAVDSAPKGNLWQSIPKSSQAERVTRHGHLLTLIKASTNEDKKKLSMPQMQKVISLTKEMPVISIPTSPTKQNLNNPKPNSDSSTDSVDSTPKADSFQLRPKFCQTERVTRNGRPLTLLETNIIEAGENISIPDNGETTDWVIPEILESEVSQVPKPRMKKPAIITSRSWNRRLPDSPTSSLTTLSPPVTKPYNYTVGTPVREPAEKIAKLSRLSEQPLLKHSIEEGSKSGSTCSSPIVCTDAATVVLSRSSSQTPSTSATNEGESERFVYASTLFICHLCGVERLIQHDAWQKIEYHVSTVHAGKESFYVPHRQAFPHYHLLMVEAFEQKAEN